MGHPPRGPLACSVAGFDSAVPTVLARPHPPALSVPWRAWRFGGVVPLFQPPCPTLIRAFVRSQSPRGEATGGTVCSCPAAPPRPISALACFVVLAVPSVLRHPPCPPDQCFRSVSFRRPLAVEGSDRCSKQVRTTLETVVGAAGVRRALAVPLTADPSAGSLKVLSLFLRRPAAAPPGG